MKYLKTLLAGLAITASLAGCKMSDFGDINYSPNSPSTAYTSMLFTGAAKHVPAFIMNSDTYDPWTQMWPGYMAQAKNDQFNYLNTTTTFSTGTYYLYAIKSLNQIVEMNEDPEQNQQSNVVEFGDNASQIGAAKTLRAFFYMTLTDIVGPLAYTEAFKGESEDNWRPAYDSQEFIYSALDADLVSAYSQMSDDGYLSSADIFYNGDMSKWKKFNASLRMMLAIKMQDVDPANGKSRFAKAYADGAMEDNSDSFAYSHDLSGISGSTPSRTAYATMYLVGNKNYPNASLSFGPNAAIVDALKEHKDPRLFAYFTLDGYLGPRPGDPNDFDAYFGIPYGVMTNTAVTEAKNIACSVADRFCEADATYNVISATRTLLVEAEAAELGWISANPKELYEEAIRLSFEDLGADDVDEYLASDKVKLSSDPATAIDQIVMQRFLAGFMTDGIESWADWRIHQVPDLQVGEGPLSIDITTFPYRMEYGDTDKDTNAENVADAVSKYLNGNDSAWQRLWWDTKDND